VIENENLQANSLAIGAHIQQGLQRLAGKYSIIGDVRGLGLMIGVELVKDRASKEPAKDATVQVFETARELGLSLA